MTGQPLPNDPVDELRKILSTKEDSYLLPNYRTPEEAARAKRLAGEARAKAIEEADRAITSLGDMSRALLLLEWQTDDKEQRDVMRKRFVTELKEVLNSNDPPRLIAAAGVLGEFVSAIRKLPSTGAGSVGLRGFLEEPNPISVDMFALTKELVAMTEHPNCLVRAAGSVALAQIGAEPGTWMSAFRRLLADPDVFVRRATIRATREQMDSLVKQITSPSGAFTEEAKPAIQRLHYTRADFRRLGQQILEALVAQPQTGLTDADPAVRYNSASLTLGIARGLRHLVTLDLPITDAARGEQSILLARFINNVFRVSLDRDLPLGRKLTRNDVEQLETLKEILRKDILEPNLGLFRAFRYASAQLACVILDPNEEVRMQARLTLDDIGAARSRARYLLDVINRKFEASPDQPRKDVRRNVDPHDTLPRPAQGMTQVVFQEPAQEKKKENDSKPSELAQMRAEFEEPSETLRALAKGLWAPPPDLRTGVAAAGALESMGDGAAPVIPALLKGLTDWNPFVRWACARTLGKFSPADPEKIVPALIPLLIDEDVDVCVAAAAALERYAVLARPAIPALIKVVGHGDDELRIAVMRTLLAIGNAGAEGVPYMIPNFKSPNRRVRLHTVRTLGDFGVLAKDAAEAIRKVAHEDGDAEIRKAASDALIKVLGN